MNRVSSFRATALRVSPCLYVPKIHSIQFINQRFRTASPYDVCLVPPDRKPCFSLCNVSVERGNQCHAKLIRAFLYEHYWSREPSVLGLWMSIHSPYLKTLTEKYAYTGDRLIALERLHRTKESKVVGVLVANKIWPWEPDELEEWAHVTPSVPERNRMYFIAHCYRTSNLFKKHNINYIYEIEVLTTAAEVTGQGVGTLLLKTALEHATELRHPLIQVIAVSKYGAKICERVGMTKEWSMDYSDFVDGAGQRVFYPRWPHHIASIYTMKLKC